MMLIGAPAVGGGSPTAPDSLTFAELSTRLDCAVPALVSLSSRCAMTDALRATAWRLFLGIVPSHKPQEWFRLVKSQRDAYAKMKEDALRHLEEVMSEPINDDEEDLHGTETIEDAADQIRRDLERCYPEGAGDYFAANPTRQKMMFDILLAWAHSHPDLSYRQGMHELLAPVVWAMTKSFEATALTQLSPGNPLNALKVDSVFLEHDSYWLFAALVDMVEPLYRSGVDTCERVQGHLLSIADPELESHLSSFSGKDVVLPQIYMLSWLRLAFARQFSLVDNLKLWDAFFSTQPQQQTDGDHDFVLVSPKCDELNVTFPSLPQWLETVATLLIVLERNNLLRATSGSDCLQILLRTVAPEPLFVAKHSRRLHADPVRFLLFS